MKSESPTSGYTRDYYSSLEGGSQRSADVVVPMVCEMFCPASVVDVGCGIGSWIHAFEKQGVATVRGIDGAHVERSQLVFDMSCFVRPTSRVRFRATDDSILLSAWRLRSTSPQNERIVLWQSSFSSHLSFYSRPQLLGREGSSTLMSSGPATGVTASPRMTICRSTCFDPRSGKMPTWNGGTPRIFFFLRVAT